MIRTLLVTAALAAAALAGPSSATPAAHQPAREVRDLPNWTTRPCAAEDSVNCRWIATGPRAQGNGTGHTYIVRMVPGRARMVCVFYAQPRYARHHDYCTTTR